MLGVVAIALPRGLTRNARWIIWTWLLITVACLSSNVARLVPPEGVLGEGYVMDRLVTVAYALGVTGLFFRWARLGFTVIAIGAMPMMMRVLGRSGEDPGVLAAGEDRLMIWGFVTLMALFDLVREMTDKWAVDRAPMTRRDVAARSAWLVAILVLAAGFSVPVKWLAFETQRQIFGMASHLGQNANRGRNKDLFLNQSLPRGFRERVRIVLLIDADKPPGYLRERVYTTYKAGHWEQSAAGQVLTPVEKAQSDDRQDRVYALGVGDASPTSDVWRVEVLSPLLLTTLCMPGNAVSLSYRGEPPTLTANGILAVKDTSPDRYRVGVAAAKWWESAYPFPDGFSSPEYLEVPTALAGAISNWVANCPGLTEAPGVSEAAHCIENYFAEHFTYNMEAKMNSPPDPIVDFMERREGYCIHFASAAALMFRASGIPSRVVGGFACSEWSSWLKRWVARERDGHAWAEVWDAAAGRWVLVEATPPNGLPNTLEKPGALRRFTDLLVSAWRRFVHWIQNVNLLVALAEGGASLILFVWRMLWSLWGVALAVGLSVWGLWRRRSHRRKQSQEAVLRAAMAHAVATEAKRAVPERLRRRETESWDDWLVRIEPGLEPEAFAALRNRIEGYQSLRYRTRLDMAEAEAWLRGGAEIRG